MKITEPKTPYEDNDVIKIHWNIKGMEEEDDEEFKYDENLIIAEKNKRLSLENVIFLLYIIFSNPN